MLTSRNWFYPLFSPFHHFYFFASTLTVHRLSGGRANVISFLTIKDENMFLLQLLSPFVSGCSQGSILGLLLFNIYMCDLFLCDYVSSTINYVDDTTLYACEPDMDLVQGKPEKVTSTVTKLHLLKTSDYIQHINVGGINSVAASMKNYQVYLQTIN